MSRLAGHELWYEGAPYTADGSRIYRGAYGGVGGPGHGMCSCGALSPLYDSGAKRKAWHRDHKAALTPTTTADPERAALAEGSDT